MPVSGISKAFAAQLRLLSVRADSQALDNQVKRGEMVLCSIVEQGISAIATLCVSRLQSLPGRLAFEIAAESDPNTINPMLRAEFDAIIEAVCRATTDFLDSLKPKLDLA
jgi:hypothetical protein